jgi:dTDP-4-dehydrorhamnose 3,5-epimerase
MTLIPTEIPDIRLIQPKVYEDARGFFLESYNQAAYEAIGIMGPFVQDNHSRSQKNALRGMHAQLRRPQGKLIRVIHGEVFDVVVDLRRNSATYKKWAGFVLSDRNFQQCYIPPGFAHGFCVLSDTAEFEYKVTDYYDPESELHLIWNDPEIGIRWPISDPILSAKDAQGVLFKAVASQLPF